MYVATDLDGTLLDHYSYSWEPAKASIERLKSLAIPIVINTSKTFAEVRKLQDDLGINSPFIVENGSAIYRRKKARSEFLSVEDYDEQLLGARREHIVETLVRLREEKKWSFEIFSDWDVAKTAENTGLSLADAELSRARKFSEPVAWMDSQIRLQQFFITLKGLGLTTLVGGRFIHVLGHCNKGLALKALVEQDQKHSASPIKLICLGDSRNDLDMLAVADIPVLIRSPAHPFPEHHLRKAVRLSNAFGPMGWHEIMNKLLREEGLING